MKIDSHIVRKCLIGFAVGILMNGTGIFATDPTNIDPKLNSVTPDTTQPDKVLLAGRGGGGRGGGSRGGSYHGGRSSRGASGYRSSPRSSSRMSSGRSGGSRSRVSSPRSKSPSSRTSSIKASSRRSSGTAGTKKSFSATSTRSKTARSKVASTRGTSSRSFATRSGGRGGGGRHHGGGGRHHSGEHGHHGHHNHDRYWGYGHWYGGWGGWYYPWWGWCFGFGLGLGYGWYGPWWGFWDFPSYWAWYWPGFALSVFYAGLYAPQPYVIVFGENRANYYYAVYTRSQDDDGNVVYIKTDRYGIVNPNEKTKIEITDRSNNVIIIARNKKKLGDKLSSDAVSSKDNYSVVDPSEAPDKLEEGENPEVTDEQIQGFQKQVKDKKNAELLKEKAKAADTADTSEAEKEADKREKESTKWEQLQATEVAD